MAGAALIALAAACTGPGAAQPPTPSPVAISSPEPIPSLRSAPIQIQTLGFSCRLPISVDFGPGLPGAFIDFPSGTVTPDPAAAAAAASINRPGRELVDYFAGRYYDRADSRWLPVSRNGVSPDGSHYAFADRAVADQQNPPARATLHVVAVKTEVELAFDDGPWSNPYVVLDYAAEGIYLITTFGAYFGLWLMDPSTGAVTRVANLSDVQGSAGSDIFWVGAINPSDPNPVGGVAPDQLDRLSLVDGRRFTWFYRPGSSVHFIGQDLGGHPIIYVANADGSTEVLVVPAPGINRPILPSWDVLDTISGPISDSHGIWFGSPKGIYYYSDAIGLLQRVSLQPGYPANGCF
jgi:hypothetical protein